MIKEFHDTVTHLNSFRSDQLFVETLCMTTSHLWLQTSSSEVVVSLHWVLIKKTTVNKSIFALLHMHDAFLFPCLINVVWEKQHELTVANGCTNKHTFGPPTPTPVSSSVLSLFAQLKVIQVFLKHFWNNLCPFAKFCGISNNVLTRHLGFSSTVSLLIYEHIENSFLMSGDKSHSQDLKKNHTCTDFYVFAQCPKFSHLITRLLMWFWIDHLLQFAVFSVICPCNCPRSYIFITQACAMGRHSGLTNITTVLAVTSMSGSVFSLTDTGF